MSLMPFWFSPLDIYIYIYILLDIFYQYESLKIKVKVNDKTEMKLQASLIAISVIFLKAINQNAMFVPKWACMGGGGGCGRL